MKHSEASAAPVAVLLHDLRSPLNAILGFSELLHDQTAGSLNEKQLKYVQQVLSAGRALLALLDEWPARDVAKQTTSDVELSEIFPTPNEPASTE